jgi:hypothetical protein
MENKRQSIELADVFNACQNDFPDCASLCPQQIKAFNAIKKCRTAVLGGHTQCCDQCGYAKPSYNSCRNRHCPKCQFTRKLQWVDKLAANLPPVRYFHIVFTIPECLNKLFYINQRSAYALLFMAAGQALAKGAARKLPGEAQTGAVAILHTWGQTLVYHPHIHMIVPAGSISGDNMEWIHSSKKFFLPVKILSRLFRGILSSALDQAIRNQSIHLPEDTSLKDLKESCYRKDWVVYCQKPFAGPKAIINYLGNYTHRVAISNNRIIELDQGQVTFRYKDYRINRAEKSITLQVTEFIRRFLQHILPDGFCKIRYYGILALRNLKERLEVCRMVINRTTFFPVLEGLSALEVWRTVTGHDPLCCPKCKTGKMIIQTAIVPNLKPG